MTMTERNEAFAKLTPEQKRVAIANDVLGYLEAQRIKATPGTYMRLTGIGNVSDEEQICSVIATAANCNVCALGATFMAAVDRANALNIEHVGVSRWGGDLEISYGDMSDYLCQFFDEGQLLMIEAAFEGHDPHCDLDDDTLDATTRMFSWTEDAEGGDAICATPPADRMRAIMQNIVANNGRFKP